MHITNWTKRGSTRTAKQRQLYHVGSGATRDTHDERAAGVVHLTFASYSHDKEFTLYLAPNEAFVLAEKLNNYGEWAQSLGEAFVLAEKINNYGEWAASQGSSAIKKGETH